jgi:hypothetical protein
LNRKTLNTPAGEIAGKKNANERYAVQGNRLNRGGKKPSAGLGLYLLESKVT